MTTEGSPAIRRDWFSKTLAGTLLGFSFAMGSSGIFLSLAKGMAAPVRAQLGMWMVVPIWLGVLSSCFLFGSGKRAWLWLGGANVVLFGALAATRMT